jgi:hypothetical protein
VAPALPDKHALQEADDGSDPARVPCCRLRVVGLEVDPFMRDVQLEDLPLLLASPCARELRSVRFAPGLRPGGDSLELLASLPALKRLHFSVAPGDAECLAALPRAALLVDVSVAFTLWLREERAAAALFPTVAQCAHLRRLTLRRAVLSAATFAAVFSPHTPLARTLEHLELDNCALAPSSAPLLLQPAAAPVAAASALSPSSIDADGAAAADLASQSANLAAAVDDSAAAANDLASLFMPPPPSAASAAGATPVPSPCPSPSPPMTSARHSRQSSSSVRASVAAAATVASASLIESAALYRAAFSALVSLRSLRLAHLAGLSALLPQLCYTPSLRWLELEVGGSSVARPPPNPSNSCSGIAAHSVLGHSNPSLTALAMLHEDAPLLRITLRVGPVPPGPLPPGGAANVERDGKKRDKIAQEWKKLRKGVWALQRVMLIEQPQR